MIKRTVCIVLAVLMTVALAACGKYVSSYKAVGFVHSDGPADPFMNFYTFDGRMVLRLSSKGEGDIKYEAKLESGNATVYYDAHVTKTELFKISGGQELDSHGGYIESGLVYIIVETDGKCTNGSFKFSTSR